MGGCMSKDPVSRSADVDVFNDTSTNTDQEDGKFCLDDEYSFNELIEKVFKIERDCIVDDDAGAVCGRINSVYETTTFMGDKIIVVQCMTIRSNGKVFFRSSMSSYVREYPGKAKLSELSIRPVLLGEKEKLADRGRKFAKCGLGAHYMMYTDKMIVRTCFGSQQISAEGRVMVDTASFLHFNPDYGDRHARRYGCGDEMDVCGHGGGSGSEKMFSTEIPEGSLHLCWPTLSGFSLKSKRWGELSLKHLEEIKFNEDAFDMLVLANESKEMVRGFVKNIHKDEQFTDIIQGKGGGCSFLLQGPPGVGKTLTAEAVSECLHRPLYCIDVGELGVTPEALEQRLKKILEVAERWDAVVLIDECDIFLASRTKDDVLRNAMVGIFLRLLEYYNGILFLTSNRAEDMDEAFQSRISVTIEYGALDAPTRKQIWSNLLGAAGTKHSDGLVDLDRLADYDLNGRQIKTAIRLAKSLASTANEPMSDKHVIQTIQYSHGGKDQKEG
ncbi:AAA family ATPase [Seminavis robusta]|uniref:AAA family ATPase n=1 Tax=Seminavis robusta TaxID=568900 RepID=A0A9N8HVL5_9STRA|nr:AAA family ATPase [Seminavis robusta]|eukprot:Sro2005_g310530.1 AAA family ATPase (499) ;mRNA; f:15964-17460